MNKKLLNNTLFYVIGSFIAPAVSFLLIPLYTSNLEPSQYAILNLVILYTGMFQTLFILSLHGSISSFFYEKELKGENMKLYVSSLLLFSLVIVTAFSVILYLFKDSLSGFLFEGVGFTEVFNLLIVYTFISALSLIPLALLRILKKGMSFLLLNLLKAALQILFVYIFLIEMELGIKGILYAIIISLLVALLLNLVLIKSYLILRFDFSKIKSSIVFSLLLLPHTLLSWVTVSFDRIVVQKSIGLHELGLYAVMLQLTSVLYLFYQGVNNAYLPSYIENYQRKSMAKSNQLKKYFIYLIVASSLVYAATIQFVAPFVLDDRYQLSMMVVYILIATQSLKGVYFANSAYFFARKDATKISKSSIVSALITIGGSLILIPYYGMIGAAIAIFLAELGRIIYLTIIKSRNKEIPHEKTT